MKPELRVLVVEDEASTRQEMASLLADMPEVAEVHAADNGAAAVRLLGTTTIDAAFLDILMPGLNGMDVARVLSVLSEPPSIVFVTASETHAVEAFGIGAVDYLLKPIRPERLAEAVGRIAQLRRPAGAAPPAEDLHVVQIDTGRRTVFVKRDDVQFVEAQGDYVRLHTSDGTHLIRLSLSYLEEVWESAGFVRVHRGFLVAIPWVRDLRVTSSSGLVAGTPAGDVPVSRRHGRHLRAQLLEAARRDQLGRSANAQGAAVSRSRDGEHDQPHRQEP
ncbi:MULTISPECIES: LytR/AlgR family response regulator transcription factor [Nocardiopsidaceae]|uniref:LytTR family DNA-binding domain-containing protein n=1 Tax=Streptomonospora nanhaiensis TaxID=1323731 RepID=A0ABY6YPY7_9ACTN|nr:LytTR family DNA-binding domain-containing protein [Streptomonospora nanhaiensis]WAE74211.1 LytTR family DNA-binding domain-containing protein [Streptomonospora nanhaiensis]